MHGGTHCQRVLRGLEESKPQVKPASASAEDSSSGLATELARVFDPAQIKAASSEVKGSDSQIWHLQNSQIQS